MTLLGGPASAVSSHSRNPLAVTALKFYARNVNATKLGGAAVYLSWTVTDSRGYVANISGQLSIAAPSSKPGIYNSMVVPVSFALHGSSQAGREGSVRKSTYKYQLVIPQKDRVKSPTWRVISFVVRDNRGDVLRLSASQIRAFKAVVTSENIASPSPPELASFGVTDRPFVYDTAHASGSMTYTFCVITDSGWLYTGELWVSGPDRKSFSVSFAGKTQNPQCMDPSQGYGEEVRLQVKFPEGAAPGTWTASKLELTDSAGNVTTVQPTSVIAYGEPGASVTVTGDTVLSAGNFALSPNPANNWTGPVNVTLSMTVSGASNGIGAVYVDFPAGSGCMNVPGVAPSAVSGDQVSVVFPFAYLVKSCSIAGVAVVDGAGDVALYGTEFGAPNPDLTETEVPDTSPVTMTAASIAPASIPLSEVSSTPIELTASATSGAAPITSVTLLLYDASGTLVYGELGAAEDTAGVVSFQLAPLPSADFPPGTYTVGLTLTDAAGASASYGTDGTNPMPGGPLTLTVTSS